jgi:hypothetical protein
MPNHCENDLYITGPANDVAQVRAAIWTEQSEIDFNAIIPYPERYAAMDRDARAFDWSANSDELTRARLRAEYRAKYGTEKDGFNAGG